MARASHMWTHVADAGWSWPAGHGFDCFQFDDHGGLAAAGRVGTAPRRIRRLWQGYSPDPLELLVAKGDDQSGGGGLLHAVPATAGAVEHGPDQADAARLTGRPGYDLDAAVSLTRRTFDEVGVPDPAVVPNRERG